MPTKKMICMALAPTFDSQHVWPVTFVGFFVNLNAVETNEPAFSLFDLDGCQSLYPTREDRDLESNQHRRIQPMSVSMDHSPHTRGQFVAKG